MGAPFFCVRVGRPGRPGALKAPVASATLGASGGPVAPGDAFSLYHGWRRRARERGWPARSLQWAAPRPRVTRRPGVRGGESGWPAPRPRNATVIRKNGKTVAAAQAAGAKFATVISKIENTVVGPQDASRKNTTVITKIANTVAVFCFAGPAKRGPLRKRGLETAKTYYSILKKREYCSSFSLFAPDTYYSISKNRGYCSIFLFMKAPATPAAGETRLPSVPKLLQ